MNGAMFLAYLKHCPAPTLKHGDIVVMDNLPVHKVTGVQKAIEAAGAELRLSAALFPRSEPHRNDRQQTEGAVAEDSRTHNSRPAALNRLHRQGLQSERMQEFPAPCRPCLKTSGICSRLFKCRWRLHPLPLLRHGSNQRINCRQRRCGLNRKSVSLNPQDNSSGLDANHRTCIESGNSVFVDAQMGCSYKRRIRCKRSRFSPSDCCRVPTVTRAKVLTALGIEPSQIATSRLSRP
jgi:hypothetical protein